VSGIFPNRPYGKKNPSQKRAGGVAQGEALSSNPSTIKKKKTQEKKETARPSFPTVKETARLTLTH
jgi:hypothetical protein